MAENEKHFEANIEEYLISPAGGFTKATDEGYDPAMALDIHTLVEFVKTTQPTVWQRFEKQCGSNPVKKFYKCFEDAVQIDGLLAVLRHGFKHRGMEFRVCYFRPESTLNQVAVQHYQQICRKVHLMKPRKKSTNIRWTFLLWTNRPFTRSSRGPRSSYMRKVRYSTRALRSEIQHKASVFVAESPGDLHQIIKNGRLTQTIRQDGKKRLFICQWRGCPNGKGCPRGK